MLAQFGKRRAQAQKQYQEFVRDRMESRPSGTPNARAPGLLPRRVQEDKGHKTLYMYCDGA